MRYIYIYIYIYTYTYIYIYSVEYYLAIKEGNNGICINMVKIIVLCEESQKEQDTHHLASLTCDI